MIALNSITLARLGTTVFENFTFIIPAGQNFLMIGNNGAGKTTLLELIAGKLIPTKGSVVYDFIDPTAGWEKQYQERQTSIHYVPVHPLHQVLGNQPDLFYQQRYYSMGDEMVPKVRDFFGDDITNLDALNFPESFDVAELLNLELTRLSNGQIKKIILIKYLLKNIPKVLLLDYPFEGLDLESRKALCDVIDHLAFDLRIQVILTDHGHELPKAINKVVELQNSKIKGIRDYSRSDNKIESGLPPDSPLGHTEPVVQMKNLTIQYGTKKIIDNFNWTIHRGERWALTGKNGSGKTTLFSLIYADHPLAYSQEVYLFGRRRGTGESIWDIKKRINYLGPEQIHFLDHLHGISVREFWHSKQPRIDKDQLVKLIDYFHLGNIADKSINRLSNGELQVVLLILFFLSEKEMLLLDEPFQFLDQAQKERVNKYLGDHLHESVTLVLITHYEADIEKWTKLRMRL